MGQTDESIGILAWGSLCWELSVLGAPKMDTGGCGGQSQAWDRKEEP